ncbi:PREDICTED: 2'-5'-oligoadenylate synthase 1-like [Tauraco erythrolophus]|uniref:2'-5'-oligoadenylate synthase 1-like n=1 Tax=Tauraco erythrolophus TaxID=121530 RepID=UPI000523AEDB|nr:PREDICTED: 2'-5'-oligoadenylate synthase 1-like [Tauraco erythrolophus]
MNVSQVTSTKELKTVTAKELDGWIMEVLQPSTDFSTQVKKTVKEICDFLKEDCFETNIRVHKTVKGGSAGKGTALKNNSDADVVLFLSCFSSYQQQKQERGYILNLIERRLCAFKKRPTFTVNISKPRYKGPDNTPRSLSLTLSSTSESIEVDILPAFDALGQVIWGVPPDEEVYVRLLNASNDPGEFSPCFTELQKHFVKRCPAKLKNLLRLVKHWYKELLKPQYPTADLPPKYALELLTIYAWEEGTGSSESFVMAEGFRTVLELLCHHQQICIYWEKYYSLQHSQIGTYVKRLLHSPREPARPRSLPCVSTAQPWPVQPARPVTIEVRQLAGTSLSRTVSPTQQEPSRNTLILQDNETLATHGIFYNTTLMLLHTEPQVMEVFVKDDKNRTTTYTVQPTDTVRQLKEQIQSRQGPSADQQRLTYDSRELEDRHTLVHYNVQPRSTIFMLLRLRGGVGSQHSQFPACSPC